jgi:hypothetical protein
MCEHLHDSTSHYDPDTKLLTFLLVCPICGIENVVETIEYEPQFTPFVPDFAKSMPASSRAAA